MDAVIIRKATPDDRQTLSDFEREAGHAGRWDSFIHSRRAVVVVAEYNRAPIAAGYASIEHSEPFLSHTQHAFISFLYVVPEHRGKGLSKRILEWLKAWAVAQNITELRLEVYVKNAGAIKAYERTGFSQHIIEMRMECG